jgi:hypothetical protein
MVDTTERMGEHSVAKHCFSVIPAQAEIHLQGIVRPLDSRFHGNDAGLS